MIERQGLDLSQVENLDRELWESGEGVILYAPDFLFRMVICGWQKIWKIRRQS